jgi:hypothetical protein
MRIGAILSESFACVYSALLTNLESEIVLMYGVACMIYELPQKEYLYAYNRLPQLIDM